jgi:uncharacterized LabA/DUF88 family protein
MLGYSTRSRHKMSEKKLRLTRKEFRDDLPDTDKVFFVQGDEKAPAGRLGINLGVAKACYLALLDPALLQELCRQVEFQPPGFRINKMDPAELFVQLVRHVQRKGYGTGPLVELIDGAAQNLAEMDPVVFKVDILSALRAPWITEFDAECWAAATWLKARLGRLDEEAGPKVAEIGSQWLFDVAASSRQPTGDSRAPQDGAAQKAKEKATAWRDRALKAEKALASLRSSRDSFERELRDAKGEMRSLQMEVSRLQEELGQRVSSEKSAEEKHAATAAQLKEGRVTIVRLEAELQELRARRQADSFPQPGRPPESHDNELSQKLERLQKSLDGVAARLNEFLTAPTQGPVAARHSERVKAFIDVANLDWGASTYFHGRVDYELLARFLNSRTPTGRARTCENVAFICLDGRSSTSAFAQTLKSLGYRVVSRTMKVFADGNTKRNVDVQLAVYAMQQTERLDTAVIVSGDGDFACLAESFASRGKRVEVLSFPNLGGELRRFADEVVILDQRILLPGAQKEIPWERQAPS